MKRTTWQRMFIAGTLLLATFFPAGAVLAANPRHSADSVPSCLQTAKEDLGSVVPGPSSLNLPAVCYRTTSTSASLIPATSDVSRGVSWSDVGASLNLSSTGGWRDGSAGSR
jgi:hypothetical protein